MSSNTETKPFSRHSAAVLGIGFALGLLVGVGMLVGSWLTLKVQPPATLFPELPLHAVATDSGENFSIATGPISENVEGIFALDFLTGDLHCWVFNARTNSLGGYFHKNIVADLKLDQNRKTPSLLMVTALTGLRGGGSSMTYGDSVVYVADATSGVIVGYGVPWNRALASRGGQTGNLMPVFQKAARNVEIR